MDMAREPVPVPESKSSSIFISYIINTTTNAAVAAAGRKAPSRIGANCQRNNNLHYKYLVNLNNFELKLNYNRTHFEWQLGEAAAAPASEPRAGSGLFGILIARPKTGKSL